MGMTQHTPASMIPEWFISQMMPGISETEALREWNAYLSTVDEVRFHGMRTGDGPREITVGIEWPDNDHLPPFMRRPDHRAFYQELEVDLSKATSFEWGYYGSGPLILCDKLIRATVEIGVGNGSWKVTKPDGATITGEYVSMNHRSDLCEKIVSKLPKHEWTLAQPFLLEFLELHIKEKLTP